MKTYTLHLATMKIRILNGSRHRLLPSAAGHGYRMISLKDCAFSMLQDAISTAVAVDMMNEFADIIIDERDQFSHTFQRTDFGIENFAASVRAARRRGAVSRPIQTNNHTAPAWTR